MFITFGRGNEKVSLNTLQIQGFIIERESDIESRTNYKIVAILQNTRVVIKRCEKLLEAEKYMQEIAEEINIPF